MKKLVATLLVFTALGLNCASAALADDSCADTQVVREKVITALVQVFQGTLEVADGQLAELKSQAACLPDNSSANEIRAALEAVGVN